MLEIGQKLSKQFINIKRGITFNVEFEVGFKEDFIKLNNGVVIIVKVEGESSIAYGTTKGSKQTLESFAKGWANNRNLTEVKN